MGENKNKESEPRIKKAYVCHGAFSSFDTVYAEFDDHKIEIIGSYPYHSKWNTDQYVGKTLKEAEHIFELDLVHCHRPKIKNELKEYDNRLKYINYELDGLDKCFIARPDDDELKLLLVGIRECVDIIENIKRIRENVHEYEINTLNRCAELFKKAESKINKGGPYDENYS